MQTYVLSAVQDHNPEGQDHNPARSVHNGKIGGAAVMYLVQCEIIILQDQCIMGFAEDRELCT